MEASLRLAFLGMGALAFAVALQGLTTVQRLTADIDELGTRRLLGLEGLWKVNEGQTQIRLAKITLLNPGTTPESRRRELNRMDTAWKQIREGMQQIDDRRQHASGEMHPEDLEMLADFKRKWAIWETKNDRFLQVYALHSQLLGEGGAPAGAARGQATLAQLNQEIRESLPSFEAATGALLKLIEHDREDTEELRRQAGDNARAAMFWSMVALALAPAVAVALGTYFSRTIARPLGSRIARVVEVAESISVGNLSDELPPTDDLDELGKLQNACHRMSVNLNQLVRQIQKSGIGITTSATQIAASGRQLEATMAEQLASTNEVTATARQIAATSRALVQTMAEVETLATDTAGAAAHSQDDLERMEELMRHLLGATAEITARLDVMNEKAANINSVVTTITRVADQTNLLSLNAAIEAEKAGEYGAGFAVVAREIRRLADQTAVATLEIEQMVQEMQAAVASGVAEMGRFSTSVGTSVQDVVRIGDQVESVIQRVQSLGPRFQTVGTGIDEASQGAQQISEAMQQLSQASQQTADALVDSNRALDQLDDAARGMRGEIERFTLAG